jgi:alkyl sulfatase BDS1-like metallo-beta-lactamase superfamily hydrolase
VLHHSRLDGDRGRRPHPDVTVTLDDRLLRELLGGVTTLDDARASGGLSFEGDEGALATLVSHLDTFTFWFPIVEP